jgi:hypothetical protein
MSNTTKQLLPSQIGCIDREWLIKEISKSQEKVKYWTLRVSNNDKHLQECMNELNSFGMKLFTLTLIQSQLFSIESILNDAFGYGYGCGFNDSDFEEKKQRNLTQPITIKL